MSKKIIKSIEINIGEATVKVSPEQANELCDALMALLGRNTVRYTYTPYVGPYATWSYTTSTADPLDSKITIQ